MTSLPAIHDSWRDADWAGAAERCRDLLRQIPDDRHVHHALGLSLAAQGDWAGAASHLERAWSLEPHDTRVARDFAGVCATLRRWNDSLAVLEPELRHLDSSAVALYLTASVECGTAARAVGLVAVAAPPGLDADPALMCEYGRALYAAGDLAAAEAVLRHCVRLNPTALRPRNALAILYDGTQRSNLALEQWSELAAARPDCGVAQLRRATALAQNGRLQEARSARLEAVRLGVEPKEYETALYLMLFDEQETGQSLKAAYRAVFPGSGRRTSAQRAVRSAGARLRVGYVGAEFTVAPARYFLRPFIAAHDRQHVDVFVYDANLRPDATTPPYLHQDDRWRPVSRASDDELLALIEADGIDVLIDASGHFPGNRLPVFARRAAPVQATFPRYPCTTGCPEIDYLFTDKWTSPEGSDRDYVEALYRVPTGYLAYAPPAEAGPVAPVPRLANGYTTFGVIQRPVKLSPTMWDLFAGVLRGNRDARLLLHYGEPELDDPDSPTSRFVRSQLSVRDVDPGRLTLVGPRLLAEHLAVLSAMDIALDTSPFGGQTTTFECLWMGVPVVTLTGDTHASRIGGGLVTRLGLAELSTSSPRAYLESAERLGSDTGRLREIRSSIREQCFAAGLTDGVTLARAMEHAYRSWCEREC